MKKAKASLAALIIYKRSKRGVLQPAELTRAIALNSATAKRLIQESKRNIFEKAETGAEAGPKSESRFKHLTAEDALEISQTPPPPPPRPVPLNDRLRATLDAYLAPSIAQNQNLTIEFLPSSAPPQTLYNGQGINETGSQNQIVHAPAELDANTTVTLHQSSRNGYWVMRPVWVQLADDDLPHPKQLLDSDPPNSTQALTYVANPAQDTSSDVQQSAPVLAMRMA
jgi:hypothetical protein